MKAYYTNIDGNIDPTGCHLKLVGEETDKPDFMPDDGIEKITNIRYDCTMSVDYEDYRYIDTTDVFSGLYTLTSVSTIGSQLKRVSPYAFRNCIGLSYIDFPDTLEEIGEWAFSNCFALGGMSPQLTLPKNLKRIGCNAFQSCYSLCEINVPKDCVIDGEENGYITIGKRAVNSNTSDELKIKVNRY